MSRYMSDDVLEVRDDVQRIREQEWRHPEVKRLVEGLLATLDTVVNCLANANDRIDELESELEQVRLLAERSIEEHS